MQLYLQTYFGADKNIQIVPLAQAGSDRKYYRVIVDDTSYIACENNNSKENESFFYFSDFFDKHGIPVPKIIDISKDRTKYIQEDVGNESLLERIMKEGMTEAVQEIYKKSLTGLVSMQVSGGRELDFSKCFSAALFDKHAVMADLNYFKYYFLDLRKVMYDKVKLNVEFEKLAARIGQIEPLYFMYRDFQGRNIILKNDMPSFIDHQGGMRGPLQYDVASLLWQAKAQLSSTVKQTLYAHYKQELKKQILVDEQIFDANYSLIVLVRLLQVLGAYGLRGIIEQRAHFLSSIPLGLENIKEWLAEYSLDDYPELHHVLRKLETEIRYLKSEEPIAKSHQPKAISAKLHILIQSFSYKKGIPADASGNGGGFVFDCRGILNPGRFDEYKKQTGRDKPVIDFLESKTKVNEFLQHAKEIIDISVEDYLQRGFEHLMISFGCTGGQHRSVYCTEAMAKYVKQKYNIDATVHHIEQEAKNWVN